MVCQQLRLFLRLGGGEYGEDVLPLLTEDKHRVFTGIGIGVVVPCQVQLVPGGVYILPFLIVPAVIHRGQAGVQHSHPAPDKAEHLLLLPGADIALKFIGAILIEIYGAEAVVREHEGLAAADLVELGVGGRRIHLAVELHIIFFADLQELVQHGLVVSRVYHVVALHQLVPAQPAQVGVVGEAVLSHILIAEGHPFCMGLGLRAAGNAVHADIALHRRLLAYDERYAGGLFRLCYTLGQAEPACGVGHGTEGGKEGHYHRRNEQGAPGLTGTAGLPCPRRRGGLQNVSFVDIPQHIQNSLLFHREIPSFSKSSLSLSLERMRDIFTLLSLISRSAAISFTGLRYQ